MVVALACVVVLATPVGTREVLDSAQDRIDVPFIRDCHGLRPHHSECGQ